MKGVFVLIAILGVFVGSIAAQTTQFSYQGSLKDGGSPANGNYDFEFLLFGAPSGGTQLGPTNALNNVAVTNGIFSVYLDFGDQFSAGANLWLEIRTRPAGQPGFTILAPRQPLATVPYASKSQSAWQSATAINAFQLGGIPAATYVVTTDPRMTDARPPTAGSADYIQNQNAGPQAGSNFIISGNGTAGGTLSGNVVNAVTQLNINGLRTFTVNGPWEFFGNSFPATNTFAGARAGLNTTPAPTLDNITGKFNSFVGAEAGRANTAGFWNSFFGGFAGSQNTTGRENSFFGYGAGGSNDTGAENTAIGVAAGVGSGNLTNATAIGARAQVTASNSLVLGSINGVNNATASTNVGIGTTSPDTRLQVVDDGQSGTIRVGSNSLWSAGQTRRVFFGDGLFTYVGEEDADDRLVLRGRLGIRLKANSGQMVGPDTDNQLPFGGASNRWTVVFAANGTIQTSDARLKTNITGLNYGLSHVLRLKPISFLWKDGSDDRTHLGLLAQDVEKIIPEAVVKSSDPSQPMGMNYSTLVPVLIKSVQEQQTQIEAQQKKIDALTALVCASNKTAEICKEK